MQEPAVNTSINQSYAVEGAAQNVDLTKLFIGNINKSACDEDLRAFIMARGYRIRDLSLMRDLQVSGANRGFAFMTMLSEEEADRILLERFEPFMGRELDIKRAAPKDCDDPLIQTKTERVFIGGLPPAVTDKELADFFDFRYGSLGKVTEIVIKKDRNTGKSRGFGFISFENSHVVDKIMLENRRPTLNNKKMEVRKADPHFPINGAPPAEDGTYTYNQNASVGKSRRSGAGKSVVSPYRSTQGSYSHTMRNYANLRPEPKIFGNRRNTNFHNRPPPAGYVPAPVYGTPDMYYGHYATGYPPTSLGGPPPTSVPGAFSYQNPGQYSLSPAYGNQPYNPSYQMPPPSSSLVQPPVMNHGPIHHIIGSGTPNSNHKQ